MIVVRALRAPLFLAVLASCTGEVTCETGQVEQDGECVSAETDSQATDVDTDPQVDTDPLAGRDVLDATLRIEWTVNYVPNDNILELICDGREVREEDEFNTPKDYVYQTVVQPGERCAVRISDVRGGALAGGRVINCSEEVAVWDEQRGYEVLVAQFTAKGCVRGCNDPIAENYDALANLDDGTCDYLLGCMDPRAGNYDPFATKDDDRCDYGGFGFVDASITTDANPSDTTLNVRCDGYNVMDESGFTIPDRSESFSVVVGAGVDCDVIIGDSAGDDGPGGVASVCGEVVASWARTTSLSANPGSSLGPYEAVVASFFMPACSGCTDPTASNFDVMAKIDDGSCVAPAP